MRIWISPGRHELGVASEYYYLSELFRRKFDRIVLDLEANEIQYYEIVANPKRWGILADPTRGAVVDEAVQPFLLKERSSSEFEEVASRLREISAPSRDSPADEPDLKVKRTGNA